MSHLMKTYAILQSQQIQNDLFTSLLYIPFLPASLSKVA